ncbi:MAG: flagellar filament capping protein FliD, partial [Planctomycetes bacterium]|nr:flagellar filament capping protein FliD [Planctomycetota bacterium]
DLGLIVDEINDAGGGVFDGRDMLASFGSVLSQSLRGVSGGGLTGTVATPSTFTITDSNAGITTISLTGREDLANIMAQINQPAVGTALVTARINADGNGIEIVDTAGGAGSLTIADTVGTAALQFGVDGTFSTGQVEGGNANLQHFFRQKSLSAMNGGKGVSDGNIRVKLSDGTDASIDTNTAKTIGDIIDRLNAVTGLTASINTFGDGILLTDTTAGSASVIIEDLSGTVAEGLNLTGTYTTAIIDRRFEFDVAVGVTDTLNEVMLAIIDTTDLVTIHTFGDGGNINPARMAIGARTSGENGTVMISSSVAELQFNQTSEARDSILLFGSSEGAGEPQVVRSRNGKFNVLSGVTLDVIGSSEELITISVDRDLQSVANDITELVDAFNSAQDRIDEQTSFDIETLETGPLHGDGIILSLENELRRLMIDPVDGLNSATNNLTSIGIRFNSTGKLTLDADDLLEALTDRFAQVVDLFTNSANVTANTPVAQYNNGLGIRTDTGNDIRINFQDGTYLEVDLDGVIDTADLLTRFNNDSRITASVSANSRRLEFVDNTTGTETFQFADLNNSGTVSSLAIIAPTDGDGNGEIVSQNLIIADDLGVSRRLDLGLERYVSPFDGLFKELENSADQQIEGYNKDISRIQGQVDLERERLQRQFAAMEGFLAESQNIQATLAGQLQAITSP